MIRAPWLGSQSQGRHAKSFFELVDLYRTLSALVGLPAPPAGVDGNDMSHVVADPTLTGKTAAFSQCVERDIFLVLRCNFAVCILFFMPSSTL